MEDINQKIIDKIEEVRANGKTQRVDDEAIVSLIYEEIEKLFNRSFISKEVVQEMKNLPNDKLIIAHDELIKIISSHSLLKDKESKKIKLNKKFYVILFFIISTFLIYINYDNFDSYINNSGIDQNQNFDNILENIKNELDQVDSVRANYVMNNTSSFLGEIYEDSGKFSKEFIFTENKRSVSIEKRSNDIESDAIIIDDNIYLKYPFLYYQFYQEEKWLEGKDGDYTPTPFDTPEERFDFDLRNYSNGWDFTRNIESIEEDLGIERINGIKCHHYKVKLKKINFNDNVVLDKFQYYFFVKILNFNPKKDYISSGDSKIESLEEGVRFTYDDQEVIIPYHELLTLDPMYRRVSLLVDTDFPSIWFYELNTWGIDGEIWVGEKDFRVYKEKYIVENSSIQYNEDDPDIINLNIYDNSIVEIVYSDFNVNLNIEAPESFITVADYVKTLGYESIDVYNEKQEKIKIKIRDKERKEDLGKIAEQLNNYTIDKLDNNFPTYYPSTNGEFQKTNDEESSLIKALSDKDYYIKKYFIDPLDPDFYYTYSSDKNTYVIAARLENVEDEDCAIENGICLYKRMGGYELCDGREIFRGRGYFKIVKEECVDGKAVIELESFLAGDWKVDKFIAKYEADEKDALITFSELDNANYLVNMDSCDSLSTATFQAVFDGGFDEGGFSVCVSY